MNSMSSIHPQTAFDPRQSALWSDAHEASGAFCPDNCVAMRGADEGPLSGLTFAVKDVFHLAGSTTGFGNPDWLATHGKEPANAPAVQALLDAGGFLAGRTISDELAYSLTGENFHYGTPRNARAPDRIPGGSSSGSAAAVAAGLVDFALGSDCGGSVRVPASYCGLGGMRPSHGRVSLDGCIPFAPAFDCAGWFAADPSIFERVGAVLLADDASDAPFSRVVIARDAFDIPDDAASASLHDPVRALEEIVGPSEEVQLSADGLDAWSATFRTIQADQIWQSLGEWIESASPRFGPGVRERFEAAAAQNGKGVPEAIAHRQEIVARLDQLLSDGTVMVMPTVPRAAPMRNMPLAEIEVAYRHKAMNLLCSAGLAGLPQISLPLGTAEGLPFGLSLIGARGSDRRLLALAARLWRQA
jgi:amidase